MSKLGKALLSVIMAVAMDLTIWHLPDCREIRQSIAVGGVVLLAGWGGAMNALAPSPDALRPVFEAAAVEFRTNAWKLIAVRGFEVA